MTLENLIRPFPWALYGKKIIKKLDFLHSCGSFSKEDAKGRGMHLAIGESGSPSEGNAIALYWLVDPEDGIIADVKYEVFGQSALIAAAEVACELLIGKNYDQARRITCDLLDQHGCERRDTHAFPKETYPHLNLVIEAIDEAAEQCLSIPLSESYVAPPMPTEMGEVLEGGYPGWVEMPLKARLNVIENVLDYEIRPYIALDGGGIEVMGLNENLEVTISYQGNCTSCLSAAGATLSFIQQTLKNRVHPDIRVVPNL